MIGKLALLCALMTAASADKVNFVHTFTKGDSIPYELEVKGGESMEMSTSVNLVIGEKDSKGTNVTVVPKSMKMQVSGQDIDQPEAKETKFLIDANGMPDKIDMHESGGFLTIPLILTYLPSKELEVGESFNIDFKAGEATYKGTGKFEGVETVGEMSVAKLSVKSVLHVGEGPDGSLDFTVNYDPTAGRVLLAKGQIDMQDQKFSFTLTKK